MAISKVTVTVSLFDGASNTDPDYKQISFSIQRELPANAVLEVSYLGTFGIKL